MKTRHIYITIYEYPTVTYIDFNNAFKRHKFKNKIN